MIWFIDDLNDYQIEITDTIRTWIIPKFRIDMEVNEPELDLYWTRDEIGDGQKRNLITINFNDVADGYSGYVSRPLSAQDLFDTIEAYIISGFAGGGDILTAKADLLSHDGISDTILAGGTDGFVLSLNSATSTGLEWVTPPSGGSSGYTDNFMLMGG